MPFSLLVCQINHCPSKNALHFLRSCSFSLFPTTEKLREDLDRLPLSSNFSSQNPNPSASTLLLSRSGLSKRGDSLAGKLSHSRTPLARLRCSKDVSEKCSKKGSYFWSWGAERLVAQTALSHLVHRLVWRSPRIAIRTSRTGRAPATTR